MKIRVKICGITDEAGAALALECGADCLGFVFAESERRVTTEDALRVTRSLPPGAQRVAVFRYPTAAEVDAVRRAFAPDLVQGEPGPGFVAVQDGDRAPTPRGTGVDSTSPRFLPVFHDAEDLVDRVRHYRAAHRGLILLEGAGRGGRGVKANWERAATAARLGPLALAGGLTPENVAEAIRRVRPAGVDVSSGVERAPGIKDPDKVRRFFEAVRSVESELGGATDQ